MGQRTHSKTDRYAASATAHRDTPPVDVFAKAGLLARGSSLPSAFPGVCPSDMLDISSPLTVAGAAPAFPNETGHRLPS